MTYPFGAGCIKDSDGDNWHLIPRSPETERCRTLIRHYRHLLNRGIPLTASFCLWAPEEEDEL